MLLLLLKSSLASKIDRNLFASILIISFSLCYLCLDSSCPTETVNVTFRMHPTRTHDSVDVTFCMHPTRTHDYINLFSPSFFHISWGCFLRSSKKRQISMKSRLLYIVSKSFFLFQPSTYQGAIELQHISAWIEVS